MKNAISNHNKTITNKAKPQETSEPKCNCRKNKRCPLDGKCFEKGVIYQATVTRNDNQKDESYIGLTENSFKTRYNGHTSSFRNEDKRNATTLSNYIWSLQDNNIQYSVHWKIIAKSKSYSTSSKICFLCLKEKFYIICQPHMATLNNRNELYTECRHRKNICCVIHNHDTPPSIKTNFSYCTR